MHQLSVFNIPKSVQQNPESFSGTLRENKVLSRLAQNSESFSGTS